MSIEKGRIREIVREVVEKGVKDRKLLRPTLEDEPNYAGRELITEQDVMQAHRDGRALVISPDAVVTPSARDAMSRYGVGEERSASEEKLVRSIQKKLGGDGHVEAQVAIAADHGGYPMKQMLIKFIQEEAGMTCLDFGTHSTDPVDYPDFAAKVAQAVAEGRCARGIIVDGAGIGSAMAANKVRGVRAARCANVAEANNAREHNDANVLTLGGKMVSDLEAQAVTAVFLKTDFGGGRHKGRVDKIIGLER